MILILKQTFFSTSILLLICSWFLKNQVWRKELEELDFWSSLNLICAVCVACKTQVPNRHLTAAEEYVTFDCGTLVLRHLTTIDTQSCQLQFKVLWSNVTHCDQMSAFKCHYGQMSQYLIVVKTLQLNVSLSNDPVVKQDANLFSDLIFQITDQQEVYLEDYRFMNKI